jgi:hypothetical protein
MKKLSALLLGTGLLLGSGAALAQQWSGTYQPAMPPARSSNLDNLGEEMQFVFGVDRVMGFSWDRLNIEPEGGGETITKTTNVSLFGSASGATTNVPRLGLDFFVTEGVSVGGSFIYLSRSSELETDADTTDLGTETAWAIHPRVGYAFALDETFSVWPRLGITYFSFSSEDPENDSTTTVSGLDLTGEIMFGISPMSHFAILIGPYLDLGLSGTAEVEPASGSSTESDARLTSFGLAVSIVGYY